MDVDSFQILVLIEIQIQKLAFFPVFQGAQNLLLGMVKLVRNGGYTDSLVRIHHAKKIEIYLDLGIVGISHIFVDKKIGNDCGIHVGIFVNRQACHIVHRSCSYPLAGSDLPSTESIAYRKTK